MIFAQSRGNRGVLFFSLEAHARVPLTLVQGVDVLETRGMCFYAPPWSSPTGLEPGSRGVHPGIMVQ